MRHKPCATHPSPCLRGVIAWLVGGTAAGGILLLLALASAPVPTPPSFSEVRAAHRSSEAQVLDRRGAVLHELRLDRSIRRLPWVGLSDISPALQAAVIASEDRRFSRHGGVDLTALVGAAARAVVGSPRRGASTISMQVATLLDPRLKRGSGPRALWQKWRQMRYAWRLESQWSKAEILEAYLNRVTFRSELQGVGAAASVLFGKRPHGITEDEACVLAALIRSPNAGAGQVAHRALALREALGWTRSGGSLEAALREALEGPHSSDQRAAQAPHVARHLLGTTPGTAMSVSSTLDGGIQRAAAETLRRHLLAVRDQEVRDGAVLVADNASGEVLAYIGSSGPLSPAPQVDGVRARRQPGSTLKPFLYALALERRLLTAASLLEDAPTEIPAPGGLYRPKNYDGQFRGLLTLRTALAASVNVPAVRTLGLLGPEIFTNHLQLLGFAGLAEAGDYYGPALALGSADVTLWELVNAYRTLANAGRWTPLRLTPGRETSAASRRVYTPETAFLISDILSDRESRSGTFGLENPLATPFWTAVKTGTSKDMRDNWCVGFSSRYTVGVWVGNFSGAPMRDVSGVTGAAPVWSELMAWLHRSTRSAPPRPPAGLVARRVNFPQEIEPERTEWFLAGTEPGPDSQIVAGGQAKILAPAAGTILALDPDIPASRQRVLLEAETAGPPLRWVMDGVALARASGRLLWVPRPGRHTLALHDEDGRQWDAVSFEVRGGAADAAP
ncbi:MAG: penicillin-binding protein 1C [candidate division NC10 bacterium]|nr:penicillin-binding protein 1C [candidate division NC10 bacterium]